VSEPKVSELREAAARLRPYIRLAALFSVAITVLALAPIGYMRDVYGPVLDARSVHTLGWVTLVLVAALALTAVLMWTRARVLMAASVKFAEIMGPRVFDATFRAQMQRLPAARQALGDLRALRSFITSPCMEALIDAPFGVVFLVLVFLIHPLMGLISLVGAVLVLIIGLLSERRVRPLMREAQQFSNQALNFVDSSGRNAQVVQAMGMSDHVRSRWMHWQQRYLGNQALAGSAQSRGSAMSKFVMLSQGSLVLGIGVMLTLSGVLPPAAAAGLVIAKILGARAMAPLLTLINSWKQVEAARDSFERLEKFLSMLPERKDRMAMPAPKGHLSVEKAAVRPPGTKQTVLSDVSFILKPGRSLGVVGPSGSGKSSLARLLIGLWPPLLGTVRLDGVDVSTWDKAQLGPHIGYLPQDVELFEGTLAENIARFGVVDPVKLRTAVELSGLKSLVEQLPEGLATEIGSEGATLSGGQRQRVGLARALYGEPRLLVLDEPNSSLDEAGERSLLKAIKEVKRLGCTVVFITHRTGLLAAADQLLVLSNGRPKMFGPRDQILSEMYGPPPQKQQDRKGVEHEPEEQALLHGAAPPGPEKAARDHVEQKAEVASSTSPEELVAAGAAEDEMQEGEGQAQSPAAVERKT
jgi:ATP-binding cassette subfamily C exporter for protease/lipase